MNSLFPLRGWSRPFLNSSRTRAVERPGRRRVATWPAAERLEDRTLLSAVSPEVCDIPPEPNTGFAAAPTFSGAPPFPLGDTFLLHSDPTANLVIYLDFNGHTTTGTIWNNSEGRGSTIISNPYGGDATFSNAERETIQRIWQRVAEDFAPFNVDVTTEDPGLARIERSSAGDTQYGMRVVFTPDGGPFGSPGGIAYLGSFAWYQDSQFPWVTSGNPTPTYVFNSSEDGAALAASHEVGHTLGLEHDGTFSPSAEYYAGHGSGPTSWGPIMGAPYGMSVTQWSNGGFPYPNPSNTEDDLAIITDPSFDGGVGGIWSGLTFRADDHGNTIGSATALVPDGGDPLTGAGLITTRNDVDLFSFNWAGGDFEIFASPWVYDPNLDISLELLDASGALITGSNPLDALNASISISLAVGQYFLRIDGAGRTSTTGNPGYSDYGSIGRYTITSLEPVDPTEDLYEENDNLATAADPLGNGGNWEQTWLSEIDGVGKAKDEDWYAIDVTAGHLRVFAELTFEHDQGDLDLFLLNSSGFIVASSEGTSDLEQINFVVSTAGTYYLRVAPWPPGTSPGNDYDLRWDDRQAINPSVSVAVSGSPTPEDGASNLTYTFTRTGSTAEALTVNFLVGGTAVFGTDYEQSGAATFSGTNGTVTFAAGSTTATVTIDPTADATVEPNESVILALAPGDLYAIGSPPTATGTISNDDADFPTVTVAVAPGSAAEDGTDTLVYTFTRTGSTAGTLLIPFEIRGTAFFNSDYTQSGASAFSGTSGHVTFAAGSSTATVTIDPTADGTIESDETVILTITGVGDYVIGSPGSATGTIVNDDSDPLPRVVAIRYGYGNNLWANAGDLATRAAPWQIRHIEYTFDRDVLVDMADLVVTGFNGFPRPFEAFSYNAVTRVAVWTLDVAVAQERLTLRLDGDDATTDGNDGVKAASGVYPPGGGYVAGGDQTALLNVLFGDVNGDGTVNITDMLLLRGANTTTDRWADINGDGIVNITDMLLLRGRNGTTLP